MTGQKKASIIIPTKNPGRIFRVVLTSVCSQKTTFQFEILVIDSGSTDGTVDYVKSLSDVRVRLHEIAPSEFGHGRTRNLAVSLTTGEYAVFITHDACPTTEVWLANLVRAAGQDDRIAGVFGRHIAYPEASPFTARELEIHFSGFKDFPVVSLDDPQRYEADEGYRQFLHFFSNNNALIRRTIWEKIPYPDVDFAEDQIWAQKIIEAGWCKAYANDAVVFHSHDYSLVERLLRSFDESHAFHRLFGYRLCPNLGALMKKWAALTIRDVCFACASGLWRRAPIFVARAFLDNFMRLLGHYLGTKGNSLQPILKQKLSLDHRMLAGSLKGKK
jgi:rhamnosyltransferase